MTTHELIQNRDTKWIEQYINHLEHEANGLREYIARNMPPHHQIIWACGLKSEGTKPRIEVVPIMYDCGDNGGIKKPSI